MAWQAEPQQGKQEDQQVAGFDLANFGFDLWRKTVALECMNLLNLQFEVMRVLYRERVLAIRYGINAHAVQITDDDGIATSLQGAYRRVQQSAAEAASLRMGKNNQDIHSRPRYISRERFERPHPFLVGGAGPSLNRTGHRRRVAPTVVFPVYGLFGRFQKTRVLPGQSSLQGRTSRDLRYGHQ
jgi:hypothetical protein